jgi:hypothetical protein
MTPSECFRLSERLRAAIADGNYTDGLHLLAEYGKAVEAAWKQMGADDPRALALQQEAEDLLRWGVRMVNAERAQALALLAELPNPGGYEAPGSSESFSVDA